MKHWHIDALEAWERHVSARPRARVRAPRGITAMGGACAAVILCGAALACGSDVEPRESSGPCAVRLRPETAARAVVRIHTVVAQRTGLQVCLAAVIAPNLVLTAAHCVSQRASSGSASSPSGASKLECDPAKGWALVEQGDGRGRIGTAYPPEDMTVSVRDENNFLQPLAQGRDVIAFGAQTRCKDDLAAVILDQALDIDPLPIRFDPSTLVNEGLALGLLSRPGPEPLQRPLEVVHVPPALGSSAAPPRALRLAGSLCDQELGAPVFSPATGALVALPFLTFASGAACEAQSESLALQLSEYSEFLRNVAARAGAELRAEASPDAPAGDAHCQAVTAPSTTRPGGDVGE